MKRSNKVALAAHIKELTGVAFKDGLVRADNLPLVLPVLGGGDLPRGAHVRVKLGEIDLITLDVNGAVTERLDVAPEPLESEEDTEDEVEAGPIAIAVDVTESEAPAGADAPTAN